MLALQTRCSIYDLSFGKAEGMYDPDKGSPFLTPSVKQANVGKKSAPKPGQTWEKGWGVINMETTQTKRGFPNHDVDFNNGGGGLISDSQRSSLSSPLLIIPDIHYENFSEEYWKFSVKIIFMMIKVDIVGSGSWHQC